MGKTHLITLTVRELIGLLAGTEEQIRRLRDGSASTAESEDQIRDLLRHQHHIVGELRRRRRRATQD